MNEEDVQRLKTEMDHPYQGIPTKQEALEALRVLRHELMKCAADAERYRKLREELIKHSPSDFFRSLTLGAFDAAVDALPVLQQIPMDEEAITETAHEIARAAVFDFLNADENRAFVFDLGFRRRIIDLAHAIATNVDALPQPEDAHLSCPDCQGKGYIWDGSLSNQEPCPACSGGGQQRPPASEPEPDA